MTEVDRLLEEARKGHPDAAQELARLLYEELRGMARRELAGERPGHTLQPTALVHEAYLRMVDPEGELRGFENRAHFFGAAASAIRRVLVDHARHRRSERKGGAWRRSSLTGKDAAPPEGAEDERWLALDVALERLAALSPLKARIVELRFFAGMTSAEVARVLSVSEPTVRREWRVARAWLRDELDGADGHGH